MGPSDRKSVDGAHLAALHPLATSPRLSYGSTAAHICASSLTKPSWKHRGLTRLDAWLTQPSHDVVASNARQFDVGKHIDYAMQCVAFRPQQLTAAARFRSIP